MFSNKEDELFELIKSLTKTEKRFFKLMSGRYQKTEGANYLRLFNIIEKQKKYNEQAIIARFKGSNFMNQPYVAKNYLYNFILDNLEYSFKEDGKDLKKKLNQAILLCEKGLYKQSWRLAAKVVKEGEKEEKLHIVMEALELERRIIKLTREVLSMQEEFELIDKKEEESMQKLKEINRVKRLETKILIPYFKHQLLRTKKEISLHTESVKDLFVIDPGKFKSNYARWLVYNIRGIYFLTIGNNIRAKDAYYHSLRMLDSNISFKTSNPDIATMCYANNAYSSFMVDSYQESLNYMKKLKELTVLYPNKEYIKVVNTGQYNTMLAIYYYLMEYDEALKCIEEIENKIIPTGRFREYEKMVFYLNSAEIYLYFNRFEKALKNLNTAVNLSEAGNYYFLLISVKILQIIILFERKEYDMLRHFTRSFYRYMAKREKLSAGEKIIIRFISKTSRKWIMLNRKEMQKGFIQLKNELETLRQNSPDEAKVLDYFDFILWLDSKMQNRPYAELVREKARSRAKAGN